MHERLTELRPQIDQEVRAGITSEFATSKIDGLVQEAARQATATTANRIIRSEVHDQVASAVESEQRTIDRTLTTATETAVSSVQGSIQQHADQAVTKIVDDKVNPEVRRLRSFSDLSSAIALARAGDGHGFDRLVVMANDNSSSETKHIAKATIDSIVQHLLPDPSEIPGLRCMAIYDKSMKTVESYESQLSTASVDDRIQAAYCLETPENLMVAGQDKKAIRSLMDVLFRSMGEDPNLNVRKTAFRAFIHVGKWVHPNEDLAREIHFLDNAANTIWWKENRARFIFP